MATLGVVQHASQSYHEHEFRSWATLIRQIMSAGGLSQTADANQWNPWVPMAYANAFYQSSLSATYAAEKAFDALTSDYFATSGIPSSSSPAYLYFDNYVNSSQVAQACTVASYSIYFMANTSDPKTWVLQGTTQSNPLLQSQSTWVTLDSQSLSSDPAAGYQTYNIASPGAYQAYRLAITANFGGVSYCNIAELQLWSGASGTGTNFSTGVKTFRPTTVSSYVGPNSASVGNYEIWGFADTLQSTAPFYIKFQYGTAATFGYSQIGLQVGTQTDGAGNILGTNAGPATTIANTAASAYPQRAVLSAATNRFAMALGYNTSTTAVILAFERLTDPTAGTDSNVGAACYGEYGSTPTKIVQAIPASGIIFSQESDFGGTMPAAVTSGNAYGSDNLYSIDPFMVAQYGPTKCFANYFKTDFQAEYPINVTWLGATHQVFPVGNSIAAMTRGSNSNGAIAMRYE